MFSDSKEVVDNSFKYLLISRAARSSGLIFVTLALPLYLHYLHFSVIFIGLLYIPITLFSVFLTLILGRLGDRIGYSNILFLGEIFPVVGLLIMSLSKGIIPIAIGAIITGISGSSGGLRGAFSPGMTAFIANNYPDENKRVNRLSLIYATASIFSVLGGIFLSTYVIIENVIGAVSFYRLFFFISFLLTFISLLSLSKLREYKRPKKTMGVMKKESFRYLLRIILPMSINAAAMGLAMPLLPLFFELRFSIDPSVVGYIYTLAYVATAIGSYVSGRYINGRISGLKVASSSYILQGSLLLAMAFTPLLFLAGFIYIKRMSLAGIGSPMRGAISVRGIDKEDYGTSTAVQGVSNRASQLTSGASGYLLDIDLGLPLFIGGVLQVISGLLYYKTVGSWRPKK